MGWIIFAGHRDLVLIIAAMVAAATSLATWILAARRVQQWRAEWWKSIQRNAVVEENLRQAHAELEVRVNERTADLANANAALQAENADRKRAEAKLGRAEETFRRAIAGADAVPYSYDYKTRTYLFMGEAIEQLTGYAPHEVTSQLWKQIIIESAMLGETAGLPKEEAARRVASGELRSWRCDMHIRTRDGKLRWLSDASVQNLDESGHPTGSMGILQDITERKQAEIYAVAFSKLGQRLSAATSLRETFEIISEVSKDLFGWDAFWIKLYDPKSDSIYSGLNIDTIDGQKVMEAVKEPTKLTDFYRRIIAQGGEIILRNDPTTRLPGTVPFGNEVRLSAALIFVPIRSRGHAVGLLSVQSYTPNAYDGQNLRSLQTMADLCGGVFERIWSEEARLKFESQFRLVWDISADGMRLSDADGMVVMVNDAYCRMVGKSKSEVEAHPLSIIHSAENQEYILRKHREEFANISFHSHLEKQVTLWNGKKVWFGLTNSLLHLPGQSSLLLSIFRDITARKRFEAQLLQSQKMETVGKLAGGVAHEFNSILTAIIGQSQLLIGDLPAESPLVKNVTEISDAANRAATLTRQLLAYGRKQILQPKTLDLNQVITNMGSMFRHLMGGESDTQIVTNPGPHTVKVDAGQIEQVILNLVMNARDAMPNGGKLMLEIANVSFDEESVARYPELKPGDYVMLAISDTGKGMSEEVKARVFEPFYSTKDVGQGTGLGLSTCYGIIKQSGGHISVYSEPGRGTTFKIYLPQVEQPLKSPASAPTPALPRGSETILLVEDDAALREMASTLLRRLGYTVWAAPNGVEALNLKQQSGIGHIDLLFTDVVMPHMSGKELADRVRALYPHTRILFTSAYTESAIVHQGVLEKGVALLQKPFTPATLAHKLREVMDQPGVPLA